MPSPSVNPTSRGSSPRTGAPSRVGRAQMGGYWEGSPGVGVPDMSLNIAVQGHSLPQTSKRAKMPLYGGPSTAPNQWWWWWCIPRPPCSPLPHSASGSWGPDGRSFEVVRCGGCGHESTTCRPPLSTWPGVRPLPQPCRSHPSHPSAPATQPLHHGLVSVSSASPPHNLICPAY